jgi:beta-phosphoglucomutase-like phosphatase (HAD superfamily)
VRCGRRSNSPSTSCGPATDIDFIVSAEDTTRCKPDPQGYLLALDGLRAAGVSRLEPGDCW